MKSAVGSDDNGLLTPSILVASIDQQRNDPEFKMAYCKMCHSFYDVLDLNGDGYLSKDEFARVFTEAGFEDNSFVHAGFERMDLNKDGKLSVDEYTSAFYKYLTTEDEHLLWGPLVA
jgi:Ca2+-binding EF-hand superfamily protein